MKILALYLIITLLILAINWLSKHIIKRLIGKSNSIKKSIRYRFVYKAIRICLLVLYTGEFLVLLGPVIWGWISADLAHLFFRFPTAMALVSFGLIPYAWLSLPISGLTMSKLKEGEEFVLFLRGFEMDNYDPVSGYKVVDGVYKSTRIGYRGKRKDSKEGEDEPFSESALGKAAKNDRIKLYGVGRPNELESPEGCKRIYLDHATWQADVAELIQRAQRVFVLVNDSDNCIWEIAYCNEHAREKTVYFIEQSQIVKSVREKMGENLPSALAHYLKQNVSYKLEPHFYVCENGNEVEIKHFNNNKNGFRNLFRRIKLLPE